MIIRKILCFFLPIMLLTSCTQQPEKPSDWNPVVGVWNNYFENTDSLTMTRVFTPTYYSYFIYANAKVQIQMNKQHYTIDETHIILEKYTQKYRLDGDTLWITNSSDDCVTKYIRAN